MLISALKAATPKHSFSSLYFFGHVHLGEGLKGELVLEKETISQSQAWEYPVSSDELEDVAKEREETYPRLDLHS